MNIQERPENPPANYFLWGDTLFTNTMGTIWTEEDKHCWETQLPVLYGCELMVEDGITELGSLIVLGMIEFPDNRGHLVAHNLI